MRARMIFGMFAWLCAVSGPLWAQGASGGYPTKPLRFVLPFPPGGPTDILGRMLAQQLSTQVGQSVVPENRPGAGGNLGAEIAAKSPPDGYTIALCATSLALSPALYAKLNYDPVRDFAPISLVATIPNVILVHPSVPAKSLKELVQLAKKNPGKLNFGSGGLGTSNHLASEMLKGLADIDLVHVPFKGSNMAMVGMMGGQVDMVTIGVPPTLPHIQAGKVRPLAVLSAKRLSSLPDVPTSREAGYDNFEVTTWYGILAPAGTPKPVVARLNGEFVKMMASPDMRSRMRGAGFDTVSSSPEEFAAFIRSEMTRWAKVVKDSKVPILQ